MNLTIRFWILFTFLLHVIQESVYRSYLNTVLLMGIHVKTGKNRNKKEYVSGLMNMYCLLFQSKIRQ